MQQHTDRSAPDPNNTSTTLILPASDASGRESRLRSYQTECVYSCLRQNTLVVLPTGLGKTLVAACVLHNVHRWLPHTRLIFTAPTKPLVKQQWQACLEAVGIAEEHMACITGNSSVALKICIVFGQRRSERFMPNL